MAIGIHGQRDLRVSHDGLNDFEMLAGEGEPGSTGVAKTAVAIVCDVFDNQLNDAGMPLFAQLRQFTLTVLATAETKKPIELQNPPS